MNRQTYGDVLLLAVLVIAMLAVDEENSEVHDIEVRDRGVEAGGQRPRQSHQQVAAVMILRWINYTQHIKDVQVIRVSRETPPSRSNELRSASGREELKVYIPSDQLLLKGMRWDRHTLRILAVSEIVFLAVRVPEDIISREVHEEHDGRPHRAELDRLERQVARLQGVDERHPREISDGQHISKPVGGDIHSCQDGRLSNVISNERCDKSRGRGCSLAYLVV